MSTSATTTEPEEARPPGHRAAVLLIWATVVACGSVVLLVAVLVAHLLEPPPFDPLGDFPVQSVENRVTGVGGPAVLLGDDVRVRSTKCADTEVTVRGEWRWVSAEPRGTSVPAGSTPAFTRPAGCVTTEYANPMPDAVVERSLELLGDGVTPSWYITGTETPLDEDGGEGVQQVWQTENFVVVAAGGDGGQE